MGSKLVHPFNPELGIGIVRKVEGRFLTVWFPEAEREMMLAAEGGGLERMVLPPGSTATVIETEEIVEIAEAIEHRYLLADGREIDDSALWPHAPSDTPIERLASLHLDSARGLANRIAGLELMELREAGGLGSFLGGRIDIFPHQLHAAERAVESEPVRWLLADEVGLGKTVEACLILSALVRTGRARSALVVAPSTLAVQWLGELYRKFHQVFVLLDEERCEAVATDFGEDVNPFEVHPFAVVPLELLASSPELLAAAEAAGLEAIVLDEAHRLASAEVTEALGPLVRSAEHAVLLTATPLQADREGFYRLFSLLHPDVYPELADFERAIAEGDAVLPCTSAVRRAEIGGLPPRAPEAVELGPSSEEITADPRSEWLIEQIPRWHKEHEKALVFINDAARLQALAALLESKTSLRMTVFHEDLPPGKRDIEVAGFRESNAPVMLCSEAGAEGRNFQFCDRMVHFDLPRDPVELEQRIGRLDRIGRDLPVEIVYFHQPGRDGELAAIYERLDLFSRPAAGLDPALAPVRGALAAAAPDSGPLDLESLAKQVEELRRDTPVDPTQVFYADAYRAEQAEGVLSRVPDDLEEKTKAFCVKAAEQLGFDVVEKSEHSLFYVEFGSRAQIDALPGVEGGSRFLGTFDREEALEKEEVDFFASGHPLVEGLLLELEDGPRGRAALVELPPDGLDGAGLFCVYKDGAHWDLVIVGADGTPRPEWKAPILEQLPRSRNAKPEKWGIGEQWAEGIRALGDLAPGEGKMVAAAFFRRGD